jgi:UDP-3-O-[3-hydroxymyristoyl] glucosamine N-acyltransferase
MPIRLGELASRFGCELVGDADVVIDDVAALESAGPRALSFLSNPALKPRLAATRAAAVVLRAEDAADSPVASILSDNPYAHYAMMAAVIRPAPTYAPGIASGAVVAESATVAASAHIAAHVSIGDNSVIGENVYVGPGSVVGPDCRIGDDSRLIANVTLVRQVEMGRRCIIHPGAVIGSDGFGNAMTPQGWVKVPQLGGVRMGDDVEIGANSTVDCGAIDDTIIENGVRIDNLCMIAHNVQIGAHTAMAAMTGVSGSTRIGKRCLLAGQVGTVGHIEICDDVVVSGKTMVSKDITKPGVYAASFPAEEVKTWGRRVAGLRRLDALVARVRKLEKESS